MRKILCILAVLALALSLTACGSQNTNEPPAPPAVTTSPKAATETGANVPETQTAASLLESVELTLPEEITRKSVSDTRAHFLLDGEIIGGIEILDIAGQRDTLPFTDEYTGYAIDVSRQVQDGACESSFSTYGIMSDVKVEIAFQDSQTFDHYFFFGKTVVYDIWVDSDVLNGQDQISILKTLHSADIINPQDTAPVNADTPILNLRIDLPDGILRMPATTTRLLFYDVPLEEYRTGEHVVGGVETVTSLSGFKAVESMVASLGEKYLGGEYETASQAHSGENTLPEVTAVSPETELAAYIIKVENDVYAVWASTAVIPKEDILKIAESCCY